VAEERQAGDVWAIGAAYESYVERWSRLVARELLRWLGVPSNSRWLDVGCGTGTLVETIVEHAAPRVVLGIDRSKGFVAHARARATDARIAFQVGMRRRWRSLTIPSTRSSRGSCSTSCRSRRRW
jgi:trans-aconitate methyltransferase